MRSILDGGFECVGAAVDLFCDAQHCRTEFLAHEEPEFSPIWQEWQSNFHGFFPGSVFAVTA